MNRSVNVLSVIGLSMLIAGCGQAVDSRVEESIDAHGEIESYAAIESYNFLIEGEEPVNVEKDLSVYLEPLAWETSISHRREGTFYVFHYRFTEEERNYISIDQENWMEMEESSEEYEEIGFESYTTIFETQGVKPTELVSKVVEQDGEEISFEQTLSNSFEGYNTIDPITQPENTIDRLW